MLIYILFTEIIICLKVFLFCFFTPVSKCKRIRRPKVHLGMHLRVFFLSPMIIRQCTGMRKHRLCRVINLSKDKAGRI